MRDWEIHEPGKPLRVSDRRANKLPEFPSLWWFFLELALFIQFGALVVGMGLSMGEERSCGSMKRWEVLAPGYRAGCVLGPALTDAAQWLEKPISGGAS